MKKHKIKQVENIGKNNILKNTKGITLIALIITIIVLLLLAGISVSMLSGQDGILQKATKAKIDSGKANEFEKVKLAVMAAIDTSGKVDKESLKTELEKNGFEVTENNLKGEGPYTFVNDENVAYKIKTNGEVTSRDAKMSVTYGFFDGTNVGLKEVPVISCQEKVSLDTIESKDGKLNLTKKEEGTISFDIVSGQYEFDYIDVKEFLNAETTVPAILVDSEWKVQKDLSKELGIDDYYVFIITDEEQISILNRGEYCIGYKFTLDTGFLDDRTVFYDYFIGKNGIYEDIYGYKIFKGGNILFDAHYVEEEYENAKELADSLKSKEGVIIEETTFQRETKFEDYEVYEFKGLFYEQMWIPKSIDGTFYYVANDVDPRPIEVRRKDTKENVSVSEFVEQVLGLNKKVDSGEMQYAEYLDFLNEYEYRGEEITKCYEKGHAISFE